MVLKGVLRKCRKYYLEMYNEYAKSKAGEANPEDLLKFSYENFQTFPDLEGFELYVGALLFSTDMKKGPLS